MLKGFARNRALVNGTTIAYCSGGSGPPLLLLHGYPQTHLMWHRVAPALAEAFTLVLPDLRGYGDSAKPDGGQDHAGYAFRAMAADVAALMALLGHERFAVAGHDRGARVTHRLCLDHPARVTRAAVLDIAPTLDMYGSADKDFATVYYHWFFLIQPAPLPETLIAANPGSYLKTKLAAWSKLGDRPFDAVFPPEVVAEYVRCFSDPATIHATCEDYRAAAGIDLDHDRADLGRRLAMPLLVLWGGRGLIGRRYAMPAIWQARAEHVTGGALDCGHFLPEEAPDATLAALRKFFKN